ncbi:MAG: efflux RND transporter periplasmic adaptor subunit [Tannerellaceae bacterium]|nr:efflux RND transporter periplasmic adaptor subunit [Tannerellaceae bacterium]
MKYTFLPVAILLLISCQTEQTEKEISTTLAQTQTVFPADEEQVDETKDAAMIEALQNQTYLNGTIMVPPQRHASVSLIMGGIIHNISLLPGEYVKKGTVILYLENPEFIQLQQTYLEATAQEEYLEAEYKRQEILSRQEAASKKRFQESKAEYLSMKSRKEAAAAQLKILGIVPEQLISDGIQPYLEVKAPISGYMTGTKMNLGKYVNAGESMCDIIDKGEAMLRLIAYEKDLDNFSTGSILSFTVNEMEDNHFRAHVISVGQEVDGVSRSLDVYAKVEGTHPRFRPGMYVTAQIEKK